jgi:hypothetical protein
MISAEDQYYIRQVEVYVSRNGNGVVDARHLKTENDFVYYKIDGMETRYVICGQYGIHGLPHRIYEGALQNECYFASSVCRSTRKYVRKLDETYFKFYDDAKEVLDNIVRFIKWLRQVPNLKLKPIQIKNIMKENEHFLKAVPDFPEIELTQALMNTLVIRNREDLKGLEKFKQDELDLVPERE